MTHAVGLSDKFFVELAGAQAVGDVAFPQAPQVDMGFRATAWILRIDGGDVLDYSFDGKTLHGRLYYGDRYLAQDGVDVEKVWFRKAAPEANDPVAVRIWGWTKQR